MNAGVLRNAPFRRLATAWTFSNFGDSALYLTLAIWVKDLTDSDASTGLVFLFLGLPAFLAPLAGHLADRFPRRRLVVVANLVAAAGVMSLGTVDGARDVWLVYAVTFGYGWLTYVTSACASGLVRDLVTDDELAGANGLLNTIDQGLRLLSPLAGAAMYARFGGIAIAGLTACSLVVAAIVVATVDMVESEPTPTAERSTFVSEVTAGMRHIRRTPILARLTLWVGVATAITGFANTTIFAAIDQGLGRGSEFFAVLASVQGLGAVIGGVTSAFVIRRLTERVAMTIGLGAIGLGMVPATGTSTVALLAGAVVVGIGIPWTYVSFTTIRQRSTPAALQGRVSAVANLAFNGPQTAGTALGAGLIAFVDYRALVVVMSVVLLACGAFVFRTDDAASSAGSAPDLEPGDDAASGFVSTA